MSVSSPAEAAEPQRSLPATESGLSKNSIGVTGIVFFVVAAAAPLTVVIALYPLIIGSGNGIGIAGAFLAIAIVLLVFSVGYVAMSRHVTNAGAFYAYVTLGLGRSPGLGAASLAVFGYNAIQLGLYGGIGYYAHDLVKDWAGIDVPWWLYSFLAMLICLVLGVNRIHSGARVLGALLTLETAVIIVLNVAILFNSDTPVGKFSFQPFAPSTIFAGAVGVALMFAHASFIGFEGTAIYGEEARDPKRTVPRATYISVIFMGVFYAITSWLIVNALGVDNAVTVAKEQSGNLVFAVSDHVLPAVLTGVIHILIITSMFAALLTFHNNVARYLFSLARQGALPAFLGRTHVKRQSPHIACVVQTIMVGVVVAVFAVARLDPYTTLFSWMTGIGAVAIILLQFVASIAIFVFFRRNNLDKRVWNTVIAPLLGMAGLAPILYFALSQVDVLLGTGGWLATLLVGLVFASLLGGIAWGLVLRKARPRAYSRLLSDVGQ
ncbi:APC family permease [Amycolatopsis pithecellobii]|uniref:Amino acid permease n=1 Tax=Amycolatopsis pithecellobii TaxID=664692 RepID=A0A6N7YYD8_9PSEU|nr:APC family permease [Amycolatopsis pithecellobii]MTD52451.1 amino acid permease [Amycolatopsis pithecellobii]